MGTHRKNTTPKTNEWKQFEAKVESIYKCLGFSTQRDVEVAGRQVDIFAEKTAQGVGRIKIAVECKYTSSTDSISREEVTEFLGFAEIARNQGRITQGVFVSNTQCSRFAKQATEGSTAVNLVSFRELEDQIFDLHDSYQGFVFEYESRRIFSSYIKPGGTYRRGFESKLGTHVDDVESQVVKWLGDSSVGLIALLGDFGAGKTTLLERLKYHFATRYLSGESARCPIFVMLKDFYKYPELHLLLSRTVQREFARDVPMTLFWRAAHEGRFVFLLDGLDEMLPQSDRRERAGQFVTLSPLFHMESPVILTCRPSYFISTTEYQEAAAAVIGRNAMLSPEGRKTAVSEPKAHTYKSIKQHLDSLFIEQIDVHPIQEFQSVTVGLEAFDDSRINAFLQNNDARFRQYSNGNAGWADVRRFLDNVYDLSDLMTRPILLDMITETVLSGGIDITNRDLKLGPTSLYEIYTDMQFDRDWKKGDVRQKFLSRDQRRLFAQAVALGMLEKGKLELRYEEIIGIVVSKPEVMSELAQRLKHVTSEQIASDIQTCAFLSRHEDGYFRFTHKSFAEYFVSKHIKSQLSKSTHEPLLYRRLPKEILYFLGGFGFMEANVTEVLNHLQKRRVGTDAKSRAFNRNVSSAIFFSGHELRDLRLSNANIDEIKIQRCEVFRGHFDLCTFEETSFEDVVFASCKWQQLSLRKSVLNNTRFRKCECDVLTADCEVDGLRFDGGRLCLHMDRTRLSHVNFSDCDVTLDGSVRIQSFDCSNINLHVALENSEIRRGTLINVKVNGRFERSIIAEVTSKASVIKISGGLTLVECTFCKKSDISVEFDNVGTLDLRESGFEESTLRVFPSQNAQHRPCEGQGSVFRNSLLLGLTITIHEYQEVVSERQHFRFENCRGFLLLACSDFSSPMSGDLDSGKLEKHAGLPILTSAAFFNNSTSRQCLLDAVDPACKEEVARYIEHSLSRTSGIAKPFGLKDSVKMHPAR